MSEEDALSSKGRLIAAITLAFLLGLGAAAGWERVRVAPTVTFVQAAPVPRGEARSLEVEGLWQLSDAFSEIAESVTPGVVRIQVERLEGAGRRARPLLAGGSGFVVSANGYILTNNHVVDGADRITVTLVDKRVFDARLVGRDPTTDLAVIHVPAESLPTLPLGDSDAARVGEWVLAVGNPGFGRAVSSTLDFTVTVGIISASGRPLQIINRELAAGDDPSAGYAIEDFIQTDAVINPGNSGGPLVNLRGEVLGVNTAIASGTGYYQGYGFAIPINLAQRVMRDLIERGQVRRPLLGVSIADLSPEDAEVYGLSEISGVLVEDFGRDSPARSAGLQRHDVIVAVDGKKVDRMGQLQRMIAQYEPGEMVEVGLVRYGEAIRVPVQLGQAPLQPVEMPPAARQVLVRREGLGIEVVELTAARAQELGFGEAGGALIGVVRPLSAAERKGVFVDMRIVAINRQTIGSAAQAEGVLRGLRSGEVASLLLESADGRTRIANVRVP